jgi:hypothetical protein
MSALGKVLAGVVLTPVAILVVGIGGCEARKAYYDWRVKKMCEQDGGVTVIERLKLTPVEASKLPRAGDHLGVAPEPLSPPDAPAFSRLRQEVLVEGNLSVVRYEEIILHRTSGKVVARVVAYARAGGDFPSYAHPSRFVCPSAAVRYAQIGSVFEIEEKQQ